MTDQRPTDLDQAGVGDPPAEGVLRTFLIADVRGYTRYTQTFGDEAAAELAARFAGGARAGVADFGGEVIELRGDEALAVFTSPRQALRAAVHLQRRFRGGDDGAEPLPLGVGIGVDAGEAVPIEGGFRGKALNVAARLCSLAAPGQILATETVSALAGRVPEATIDGRRAVRVKGIDEPVRLLELVPEGGLPPLPAFGAPQRRPLGRTGVAVGAAAAVLVGAALAFLVFGGEGRAGRRLTANSLGHVDPSSGEVAKAIEVGSGPSDVTAGAGSLWVVNSLDASVWRIDPAGGTVTDKIPVGKRPVAAAFGDGALWVVDAVERKLHRIDPRAARTVKTYPVGNGARDVVFGAGAAWVANEVDGTVSKVDVETEQISTSPVGIRPTALAVGAGAVWVANAGSDSVARLDTTSRSLTSIGVGRSPVAVAVGGGSLWVANAADRTVWQLDPATRAVRDVTPLPAAPTSVDYAGGDLWVASEAGGSLTRLSAGKDPVSYPVGGGPVAVEAGTSVWTVAVAPLESHRGGVLRIAGPFPVTDPHVASFGANVNPLLNDGLVAFKAVGGPAGATVVPDLASDFPRTTDGGRRYTFTLRDGIRYSTGGEVKASDVRASLERMFAVESGGAPLYDALTGAGRCLEQPSACDLSRAVLTDDGARTVTFVLERPDPDFLLKLALPPAYVLPASTLRRPLTTTIVAATGPYQVARVVRNRSMVLTRNPHFREWSHDAQPNGFPDRIEIRNVESPDRQLGLVLDRRADTLFPGPPDAALERLAVRYPTQLHATPQSALVYVFMNGRERPFGDVRVRRAVNLALDRRKLVSLSGGPFYGTPTCQLVPPNILGYRPYCPYTRHVGGGVWTAPDIAAARRLVRASRTAGARVTVWTSDLPLRRRPSEYLARVLRSLGYRVDVRVVRGTIFDYYGTVADPKRRAQIGLARWGLDLPTASDVFGPLLSCSSPPQLNLAHFCDRAVDRESERAARQRTTDVTASAATWARLDRDLVDRAVLAPAFVEGAVDFVSTRVGNFQRHPVWGPMYGQLWVR